MRLNVRPAMQKAFWAVMAIGGVYFAFHAPAKSAPIHAPGSVSPPTPAGLSMPWPATWEC